MSPLYESEAERSARELQERRAAEEEIRRDERQRVLAELELRLAEIQEHARRVESLGPTIVADVLRSAASVLGSEEGGYAKHAG